LLACASSVQLFRRGVRAEVSARGCAFLALQGRDQDGWRPRITTHESRVTNHESRVTPEAHPRPDAPLEGFESDGANTCCYQRLRSSRSFKNTVFASGSSG